MSNSRPIVACDIDGSVLTTKFKISHKIYQEVDVLRLRNDAAVLQLELKNLWLAAAEHVWFELLEVERQLIADKERSKPNTEIDIEIILDNLDDTQETFFSKKIEEKKLSLINLQKLVSRKQDVTTQIFPSAFFKTQNSMQAQSLLGTLSLYAYSTSHCHDENSMDNLPHKSKEILSR